MVYTHEDNNLLFQYKSLCDILIIFIILILGVVYAQNSAYNPLPIFDQWFAQPVNETWLRYNPVGGPVSPTYWSDTPTAYITLINTTQPYMLFYGHTYDVQLHIRNVSITQDRVGVVLSTEGPFDLTDVYCGDLTMPVVAQWAAALPGFQLPEDGRYISQFFDQTTNFMDRYFSIPSQLPMNALNENEFFLNSTASINTWHNDILQQDQYCIDINPTTPNYDLNFALMNGFTQANTTFPLNPHFRNRRCVHYITQPYYAADVEDKLLTRNYLCRAKFTLHQTHNFTQQYGIGITAFYRRNIENPNDDGVSVLTQAQRDMLLDDDDDNNNVNNNNNTSIEKFPFDLLMNPTPNDIYFLSGRKTRHPMTWVKFGHGITIPSNIINPKVDFDTRMPLEEPLVSSSVYAGKVYNRTRDINSIYIPKLFTSLNVSNIPMNVDGKPLINYKTNKYQNGTTINYSAITIPMNAHEIHHKLTSFISLHASMDHTGGTVIVDVVLTNPKGYISQLDEPLPPLTFRLDWDKYNTTVPQLGTSNVGVMAISPSRNCPVYYKQLTWLSFGMQFDHGVALFDTLVCTFQIYQQPTTKVNLWLFNPFGIYKQEMFANWQNLTSYLPIEQNIPTFPLPQMLPIATDTIFVNQIAITMEHVGASFYPSDDLLRPLPSSDGTLNMNGPEYPIVGFLYSNLKVKYAENVFTLHRQSDVLGSGGVLTKIPRCTTLRFQPQPAYDGYLPYMSCGLFKLDIVVTTPELAALVGPAATAGSTVWLAKLRQQKFEMLIPQDIGIYSIDQDRLLPESVADGTIVGDSDLNNDDCKYFTFRKVTDKFPFGDKTKQPIQRDETLVGLDLSEFSPSKKHLVDGVFSPHFTTFKQAQLILSCVVFSTSYFPILNPTHQHYFNFTIGNPRPMNRTQLLATTEVWGPSGGLIPKNITDMKLAIQNDELLIKYPEMANQPLIVQKYPELMTSVARHGPRPRPVVYALYTGPFTYSPRIFMSATGIEAQPHGTVPYKDQLELNDYIDIPSLFETRPEIIRNAPERYATLMNDLAGVNIPGHHDAMQLQDSVYPHRRGMNVERGNHTKAAGTSQFFKLTMGDFWVEENALLNIKFNSLGPLYHPNDTFITNNNNNNNTDSNISGKCDVFGDIQAKPAFTLQHGATFREYLDNWVFPGELRVYDPINDQYHHELYNLTYNQQIGFMAQTTIPDHYLTNSSLHLGQILTTDQPLNLYNWWDGLLNHGTNDTSDLIWNSTRFDFYNLTSEFYIQHQYLLGLLHSNFRNHTLMMQHLDDLRSFNGEYYFLELFKTPQKFSSNAFHARPPTHFDTQSGYNQSLSHTDSNFASEHSVDQQALRVTGLLQMTPNYKLDWIELIHAIDFAYLLTTNTPSIRQHIRLPFGKGNSDFDWFLQSHIPHRDDEGIWYNNSTTTNSNGDNGDIINNNNNNTTLNGGTCSDYLHLNFIPHNYPIRFMNYTDNYLAHSMYEYFGEPLEFDQNLASVLRFDGKEPDYIHPARGWVDVTYQGRELVITPSLSVRYLQQRYDTLIHGSVEKLFNIELHKLPASSEERRLVLQIDGIENNNNNTNTNNNTIINNDEDNMPTTTTTSNKDIITQRFAIDIIPNRLILLQKDDFDLQSFLTPYPQIAVWDPVWNARPFSNFPEQKLFNYYDTKQTKEENQQFFWIGIHGVLHQMFGLYTTPYMTDIIEWTLKNPIIYECPSILFNNNDDDEDQNQNLNNCKTLLKSSTKEQYLYHQKQKQKQKQQQQQQQQFINNTNLIDSFNIDNTIVNKTRADYFKLHTFETITDDIIFSLDSLFLQKHNDNDNEWKMNFKNIRIVFQQFFDIKNETSIQQFQQHLRDVHRNELYPTSNSTTYDNQNNDNGTTTPTNNNVIQNITTYPFVLFHPQITPIPYFPSSPKWTTTSKTHYAPHVFNKTWIELINIVQNQPLQISHFFKSIIASTNTTQKWDIESSTIPQFKSNTALDRIWFFPPAIETSNDDDNNNNNNTNEYYYSYYFKPNTTAHLPISLFKTIQSALSYNLVALNIPYATSHNNGENNNWMANMWDFGEKRKIMYHSIQYTTIPYIYPLNTSSSSEILTDNDNTNNNNTQPSPLLPSQFEVMSITDYNDNNSNNTSTNNNNNNSYNFIYQHIQNTYTVVQKPMLLVLEFHSFLNTGINKDSLIITTFQLPFLSPYGYIAGQSYAAANGALNNNENVIQEQYNNVNNLNLQNNNNNNHDENESVNNSNNNTDTTNPNNNNNSNNDNYIWECRGLDPNNPTQFITYLRSFPHHIENEYQYRITSHPSLFWRPTQAFIDAFSIPSGMIYATSPVPPPLPPPLPDEEDVEDDGSGGGSDSPIPLPESSNNGDTSRPPSDNIIPPIGFIDPIEDTDVKVDLFNNNVFAKSTRFMSHDQLQALNVTISCEFLMVFVESDKQNDMSPQNNGGVLLSVRVDGALVDLEAVQTTVDSQNTTILLPSYWEIPNEVIYEFGDITIHIDESTSNKTNTTTTTPITNSLQVQQEQMNNQQEQQHEEFNHIQSNNILSQIIDSNTDDNTNNTSTSTPIINIGSNITTRMQPFPRQYNNFGINIKTDINMYNTTSLWNFEFQRTDPSIHSYQWSLDELFAENFPNNNFFTQTFLPAEQAIFYKQTMNYEYNSTNNTSYDINNSSTFNIFSNNNNHTNVILSGYCNGTSTNRPAFNIYPWYNETLGRYSTVFNVTFPTVTYDYDLMNLLGLNVTTSNINLRDSNINNNDNNNNINNNIFSKKLTLYDIYQQELQRAQWMYPITSGGGTDATILFYNNDVDADNNGNNTNTYSQQHVANYFNKAQYRYPTKYDVNNDVYLQQFYQNATNNNSNTMGSDYHSEFANYNKERYICRVLLTPIEQDDVINHPNHHNQKNEKGSIITTVNKVKSNYPHYMYTTATVTRTTLLRIPNNNITLVKDGDDSNNDGNYIIHWSRETLGYLPWRFATKLVIKTTQYSPYMLDTLQQRILKAIPPSSLLKNKSEQQQQQQQQDENNNNNSNNNAQQIKTDLQYSSKWHKQIDDKVNKIKNILIDNDVVWDDLLDDEFDYLTNLTINNNNNNNSGSDDNINDSSYHHNHSVVNNYLTTFDLEFTSDYLMSLSTYNINSQRAQPSKNRNGIPPPTSKNTNPLLITTPYKIKKCYTTQQYCPLFHKITNGIQRDITSQKQQQHNNNNNNNNNIIPPTENIPYLRQEYCPYQDNDGDSILRYTWLLQLNAPYIHTAIPTGSSSNSNADINTQPYITAINTTLYQQWTKNNNNKNNNHIPNPRYFFNDFILDINRCFLVCLNDISSSPSSPSSSSSSNTQESSSPSPSSSYRHVLTNNILSQTTNYNTMLSPIWRQYVQWAKSGGFEPNILSNNDNIDNGGFVAWRRNYSSFLYSFKNMFHHLEQPLFINSTRLITQHPTTTQSVTYNNTTTNNNNPIIVENNKNITIISDLGSITKRYTTTHFTPINETTIMQHILR